MDDNNFNRPNYRVTDFNEFQWRDQSRFSDRDSQRGSQRDSQRENQRDRNRDTSWNQDRSFNRDQMTEDYGGADYNRQSQFGQNQQDRYSRNQFGQNQQNERSAQNRFGSGQTDRYRQNTWNQDRQQNRFEQDRYGSENRSFNQGRMDYNQDIPTYSSNYGSRGSQFGQQRQQSSFRPEGERYDARNNSQYSWGSTTYRNWNPSQDYSLQGHDHEDTFRDDRFREFSRNRNHAFESQNFDQDRSDISMRRDYHPEEGFIETVKNTVRNFFGKGPKGYQRSDERIKEDISEMLYRHPRIDATDIEVAVKSGTVTLTGTVHDRQMKRLVEDKVEECSGVNNVINQLLVNNMNTTWNAAGSNSTLASSTAASANSTTTSSKKNVQ